MKKKYLYWIVFIIFIVVICSGINYYLKNRPVKVNWDLTKMELNDSIGLMIVAHPDDETLWGSNELINEDYVVVCITCGANKTRVDEFKKIMDKTNDQYIMLGYPDKTDGKRDDWSSVKEAIMADLKEISNANDWKKIVTHNPDGEYGHNQHIMTSDYVSTIIADKSKLFYFGYYYNKNTILNIETSLSKLDDTIFNYKVNELLPIYKSQTFLDEKFSQMYPYEDLISFEKWRNKS